MNENPFNLDEMSRSPALMSIKAALPHLEPKHRKMLGVLVKLIEIQQLMEVYTEDAANFGAVMASAPESERKRSMLAAVRPFLPEDKRAVADTLISLIDMKEVLENCSFGA